MPQFDFFSFFAQSFLLSLGFGFFYLVGLYYFYNKLAFNVLLRKKIADSIAEKTSEKKKLLDIMLRNIFTK